MDRPEAAIEWLEANVRGSSPYRHMVSAQELLAYIKELEDTNAKWIEWNERRQWTNSLSDYHYP